VVTRTAGLRIVDVRDPFNPREIGALDNRDCQYWGAKFEIVGSFAVATGGLCMDGGSQKIQVIDLSDLSRPVVVASIEGPYQTFAVSGSHLLAMAFNSPEDGWSLDVFDLSDAQQPRHVGSYQTSTDDNVWAFAADWPLMFVKTSSDLTVIDFSDPSQPTPTVLTFPGWILPVTAADGYLYAYSRRDHFEVQIWDVGDPVHPVEMGSCEVPYHGSPFFSPGFSVYQGTVFLGQGIQGLIAVDVSLPTQPRIVSQLFDGSVSDVATSGSYAYWLAYRWSYLRGFEGTMLRITDISDPRDPIDVGWYATEKVLHWDVTIVGSHAYLVGDSGLAVIDVGDPSNPVEVSSLDTPATGIAVSGTHAYLAARSGRGMHVIDIADPESPREVAYLESAGAALEAIAASGRHVFVATKGRFRVIDVSDPSSPHVVSTLGVPDFRSDWWGSMVVQRSIAYLATGSSGVVVIDVGDPSSPREVRRWGASAPESVFPDTSAGSIAVSGRMAYIAGIWATRAIDMSDPDELSEVVLPYSLPFRSIPFHTEIAIRGSTALVADSSAGAAIVDIGLCDDFRQAERPGRNR
jgi:hypothetical protein